MVRSRIKQENVADVEAAGSRLFTAIREARLGGIRYVSSLLSDGVTFVALLEVAEGVENPLPAPPEAPGGQGARATCGASAPCPAYARKTAGELGEPVYTIDQLRERIGL